MHPDGDLRPCPFTEAGPHVPPIHLYAGVKVPSALPINPCPKSCSLPYRQQEGLIKLILAVLLAPLYPAGPEPPATLSP